MDGWGGGGRRLRQRVEELRHSRGYGSIYVAFVAFRRYVERMLIESNVEHIPQYLYKLEPLPLLKEQVTSLKSCTSFISDLLKMLKLVRNSAANTPTEVVQD